MEVNPYAASTSNPYGTETVILDDAELVRRKYLNHEASVKGVGALYLIGGFAGVVYGLFLIAGGLSPSVEVPDSEFAGADATVLLILGSIVAVLSVLQFYAGLCMRKLRPHGRSLGSVVAAIGLLGFPAGTLISAYILWLLLSEKGKLVFSPEYRAVIDATPHVRYKTSILVWIFLILLLLVLVVGMAAMMFSLRV